LENILQILTIVLGKAEKMQTFFSPKEFRLEKERVMEEQDRISVIII
jgi:hypothetical protein